MQIIFPDDTADTIDGIRTAIGRDVEIYSVSLIPCSACTVNPVTNLSTNPFCYNCSGEYWIVSYVITTVSAHVTWNPSEVLSWYTGGKVYDADCLIQIKYTPERLAQIEDCDHLVVDGRELKRYNVTLRGVKDLNRILVGLKER